MKFVTDKARVNEAVNKALMKMTFSNMFPKCMEQNDRPFGLIILVIGDYNLEVFIPDRVDEEKEVLDEKEVMDEKEVLGPVGADYLEAPAALVFKGISKSNIDLKLLEIAPANASYHGINPENLKSCDRMHDLTRDISRKEVEVRIEKMRIESERIEKMRTESEGHSSKRARLEPSSEDVGGPSNI